MKTISFTSGELARPPFGPVVDACIKALHDGKTNYAPTQGIYELRSEIAKLYKSQLFDLGPENVLITPGARPAIFNVLTNLLRSGDEVILPTPHYFAFPDIIEQAGGVIKRLETLSSDNFYISPKLLEALITDKTRVFIFNNPSNPTGRVYTENEMEGLVEVLERYPHIYILTDEIYQYVNFGHQFVPFGSWQTIADRLITVSGFSKAFSMAGFRIGYLTANEKHLQNFRRYQEVSLSGVSPFIQEAALEALRIRDAYLPGLISELREKRDRGLKLLNNIPGITCNTPEGAYYFYPEVSGLFGKVTPAGKVIESATDFAAYLNQIRKVQVFVGNLFGNSSHLRLSFAIEAHDLYEGLERMAEAVTLLK